MRRGQDLRSAEPSPVRYHVPAPHRIALTVYLTGWPGRRGWAANLEAEPSFTFHLKVGVLADLPARAEPVSDEGERRRIFIRLLGEPANGADADADLEVWVAGSPLFVVSFDPPAWP